MSLQEDDKEATRPLLPEAVGPAARYYGTSNLAVRPQRAEPVPDAARIDKVKD